MINRNLRGWHPNSSTKKIKAQRIDLRMKNSTIVAFTSFQLLGATKPESLKA
jgi:hypothetical protein